MQLERLILKSKLVTLFDLFLDQCLQIQVKGAGTRKLRRRNMAWVGSLCFNHVVNVGLDFQAVDHIITSLEPPPSDRSHHYPMPLPQKYQSKLYLFRHY